MRLSLRTRLSSRQGEVRRSGAMGSGCRSNPVAFQYSPSITTASDRAVGLRFAASFFRVRTAVGLRLSASSSRVVLIRPLGKGRGRAPKQQNQCQCLPHSCPPIRERDCFVVKDGFQPRVIPASWPGATSICYILWWVHALPIKSNEAPPQTAEMYGGGSGRRFMTGSGKTSPK